MEKLKVDSPEEWKWVDELVPSTWIKAFFNEFPKCVLLLKNHCEVSNSYILEATEMPIKSMLDTIFYKMMQRIETKKREALKWPGILCQKIKKKLDKFTEWSVGAFVQPSANGVYHVRTGEFEKEYSVDIKKRTCDCKREISGIPCHHAIACCRFDRIDAESLVHNCYTIETYMEAYGYSLVPLRAQVHWQKMNAAHLRPPLYTKVMGRPRKNRKKAPEEKEKNGRKYVTRHSLTMHCGICGKPYHNKKGHYKHVQAEQMQGQDGVQLEQVEEQVANIEEEAEYDDPTILQSIIPQNPSPTLDPLNVVDSMVYKMGQEERAHAAADRSHGPIPEESSFAVDARDSIPGPRVILTTAITSGRGINQKQSI